MEIVYLKTTFFSFYHDERNAPDIIAMRGWTRKFWDAHRGDYNLVTSPAVLDELRKGGAYHKEAALKMALEIPVIVGGSEIPGIVEAYIENQLMPRDVTGDALHLAFASLRQCDYLCDVELPPSGKREQVQTYTRNQPATRTEDAGFGDTA